MWNLTFLDHFSAILNISFLAFYSVVFTMLLASLSIYLLGTEKQEKIL